MIVFEKLQTCYAVRVRLASKSRYMHGLEACKFRNLIGTKQLIKIHKIDKHLNSAKIDIKRLQKILDAKLGMTIATRTQKSM